MITLLKILLSLWMFSGAVYLLQNYTALASNAALSYLPEIGWKLIVVAQILLSVTLLLSAFKSHSLLTKLGAYGLAFISLSGLFLYSAYAGFPGLLWGLLPALLFIYIGSHSRTHS